MVMVVNDDAAVLKEDGIDEVLTAAAVVDATGKLLPTPFDVVDELTVEGVARVTVVVKVVTTNEVYAGTELEQLMSEPVATIPVETLLEVQVLAKVVTTSVVVPAGTVVVNDNKM